MPCLTKWWNGGAVAGALGSTSQGGGASARGPAAGTSPGTRAESGSPREPGHEERAGTWPEGTGWRAAATSGPSPGRRPASDGGGEPARTHADRSAPAQESPVRPLQALRGTPSCTPRTESLAQEAGGWRGPGSATSLRPCVSHGTSQPGASSLQRRTCRLEGPSATLGPRALVSPASDTRGRGRGAGLVRIIGLPLSHPGAELKMTELLKIFRRTVITDNR